MEYIDKTCLQCDKKFTSYRKRNRIFCSRVCMSTARRGKPTWNKGLKTGPLTEEHKRKILKKGAEAPNWRGDKAGYRAIHYWITNQLGKPDKCVHCDEAGLSGHKIHWANVSGKYKREIKDWIRLCVACHKIFDLKRGLSI